MDLRKLFKKAGADFFPPGSPKALFPPPSGSDKAKPPGSALLIYRIRH
ncbi:hypothetical protein EVA_20586 [gut metagenome]|uniref:Uncharacterized protein n=1 Tax=gut metagenome TaxID=749906 RepID=J9FNY1_9ZZZZ